MGRSLQGKNLGEMKMSLKMIVWVTISLAFFLVGGRAAAATYYFSSVTGLDGNTSAQAQSKSTPWAHLPCMANATGNAAAYTPVAGDTFILKGGDTWLNASFPCNWKWSGTVSNRITITVDKAWYTGGSWTRPIWDAEGIAIAGARNMFLWFNLSPIKYVTFSSIEMKRLHWDVTPAWDSCAHVHAIAASFITLDNFYIHAWTHGTYASGTRDRCRILLGDSNVPHTAGSVLQNSVVDGSDSTGGGDSGSNFLWPSFVNNVMHDFPNLVNTKGDGTISGNTLYNCDIGFDVDNHPNAITTRGAAIPHTIYIHDNVIHDLGAGCEAAFIANENETVYVWNNLWYNLNGNSPSLIQRPIVFHPGAAVGNAYFWNNTIVAKAENFCITAGHIGGTPAVIKIQNNHCISTLVSAYHGAIVATSLTISNNLLQTPTVANGQGYTNTQTYAYSPTDATDSTIGAVTPGVNLSSNCAGALAGLCFDTTHGQGFNASTKMVTGALRGTVSRPSGGSWNVGAYHAGGNSDLQSPLAPMNLAVH